MKLIKQFGIHKSGTELDANENLKKHLVNGGFVEAEKEPEVKKVVKKPKK